MTDPILKTEHLAFSYPVEEGEPRPVLNGVDLESQALALPCGATGRWLADRGKEHTLP